MTTQEIDHRIFNQAINSQYERITYQKFKNCGSNLTRNKIAKISSNKE